MFFCVEIRCGEMWGEDDDEEFPEAMCTQLIGRHRHFRICCIEAIDCNMLGFGRQTLCWRNSIFYRNIQLNSWYAHNITPSTHRKSHIQLWVTECLIRVQNKYSAFATNNIVSFPSFVCKHSCHTPCSLLKTIWCLANFENSLNLALLLTRNTDATCRTLKR